MVVIEVVEGVGGRTMLYRRDCLGTSLQYGACRRDCRGAVPARMRGGRLQTQVEGEHNLKVRMLIGPAPGLQTEVEGERNLKMKKLIDRAPGGGEI